MNHRRQVSRKNKIKVLLISDDKLVLEGWEQALNRATDIETHRYYYKLNPKPIQDINYSPDIILFEAAWLKRSSFSKWISERRLKGRVKTIAVFKDIKHLARHRHLLDEAIQTGFHRQELINLAHGLRYDDKALCTYYDQQLKRVYTKGSLREYSELAANILQLVFAQNLKNPQVKSPQPNSVNSETYIVFENYAEHPFWMRLKKKHNLDYVVFSIQDNPLLLQPQFVNLTAFLSEPFGKIGFLINRKAGEIKHLDLQIAAFKNEGNMILTLFNSTIHNLLASKAAGADPTDLIEDLYQELFVAIREKKKMPFRATEK